MNQIPIVRMLLAATLLMACHAQAGGFGRATPCERSAVQMLSACHFEAKDDVLNTRASCRHQATAKARSECFAMSRETYYEARGTCRDQYRARAEACEVLGEFRHRDPLADPSIEFIHPDDVPGVYPANPYVSVATGRTLLLRAGEDFEELVVIHVSDEVREVGDVNCRVVWDVVLEVGEEDGEVEYDPVEVTEDWFAQSANGDVFYCGEAVRDYEDGIVIAIDGSFESGINYAHGGFLTKAAPALKETHRQEMDLGNAEDIVQYLELNAIPSDEEGGDNPNVPCAPTGCLKTFDFSPLSPESTEFKYYLAGVGFILAVSLEDGEFDGEREELVCAGQGLETLEGGACGLDDPEQLLDALCELVPDALCVDN